ncbi:MAG: hypothetical protein JSV22_03110 [Bacteroidales bacterium]|nr:MAG: hypothetical protein JSV22_03110 [Bacteroidales bacterium]
MKFHNKIIILFIILIPVRSLAQINTDFEIALNNGILANEGFKRCNRYMTGWLSYADPATGLLPRTVTGDNYWNAKDAAADNYPFMVLSAYFTDTSMFNGVMTDILNTEIALTSRIGSMPDTYDFTTQSLQENSLNSVIFGSSEYIKDGLLPMTEWLGTSPWSDRMLSIMNSIWEYAEIETEFGVVPSTDHEVAGELLQSLSRIFWMTGEQKYIDWAIRLGNYFLLGDNHPTNDAATLRLRDHGNEVVAGLTELYATISRIDTVKKASYEIPVYNMLDRILEIGRNDDGFLYNEIYPQSGTHSSGLADTWGYVLNAHYTVYLIDGIQQYREAVIKALESTGTSYYTNTHRFGEVMDGHADAIESALNLYNREYTRQAETYMDTSIRRMWNLQQPDGIIEGWYGDGNFARTSIMYCLWKTQGLTISNWNEDVSYGAVLCYNYESPAPSDIIVNSTNSYEILQNETGTGTLIYTDRDYSIKQLPEYLLTETIIRTACNDKNIDDDVLLTFTAPSDIIVYIAVDKRVTSVPGWMNNWELTGDDIITSLEDLEFDLYSKSFVNGTEITLGGPQAEGFEGYTSSGNYVVFIKEGNIPDNRPQKSKNTLKISLSSANNWEGRLIFDTPRHRTHMNLPFNWARINQFPEWFTVEEDSIYTIHNLTLNSKNDYTGLELVRGIPITLEKDTVQNLIVIPESETSTTSVKESEDVSVKKKQPSFRVLADNHKIEVHMNKSCNSMDVAIYEIKGSLLWQCSNIPGNNIIWPVNGRKGIFIIKVTADNMTYSEKIVIP